MEKSRDYWRKRFELLEEAQNKKAETYYKDLEKAYIQTMKEIEKDISRWYQRFADNNQITLTEAKKLLKTDELKEFKWDVFDYIKYGEENALNQQWMKELENASARVHISRLESLRLQLQHHIEKLYGGQIEGFERLMKEVYQEQYYHTIFEVQKAFEVGFTLQVLDDSVLTKVISKPWTADGLTFSARIWRDKNLLLDTLHKEMIQSFARGESPDRLISVIQNKMNTSRSNAARLVQTEQAFFSSAAQKDAFKELDIEKYEIVATLDSRTSEICQSMDGKVFKMSDYEPGVTANPFHPRCRTTTCPYFDDIDSERFARSIDGKTYYVPSNMSYKEWYNKTVVIPKENATQKIIKQIRSDIKSGKYNLKFNKQHYEKHDMNHKRYADYVERNKVKGKPKPSYLLISYEEAQELVEKCAGTGKILLTKDNQWKNREVIVTDKIIGVHVDQETGKETQTKAFKIHYSKKGVHIVPTLVDEED